ncbi:MAG: type II secretion system F family protein [Acidimicrobiia bacterium]
MTWVLASIASIGVYLLVVPSSRTTMAAFLEPYLTEVRAGQEGRRWSLSIPAGGSMAAIGGAFVGLLVAQGDLFLAGASRSSLALAVLGSAAGWVLWSMRQTNLRERRARRLQFELPVVADAVSLHVVAGESISASIQSVATETNGVAAEELRAVMDALESGDGLSDALAEASRHTAHPDATRLYETLSHAHATGGRLASALGDLAVDYRAALERDLTSESGKRAIAAYGPVLALMVPTALVFLIYPTLLGLRSLAGAP